MDFPASVAGFAARARDLLPGDGFAALFPASGPSTWRANVDELAAIRLRPRVLTGHAVPEITTTILGATVALPILTAPVGAQQRMHPEGEFGTAKGAARAGVITCVSSLSTFSLREIAGAGGPRWYQLYLTKDRRISAALIKEAEDNGFQAIILTVDNVAGLRANDGQAIEALAVSSAREAAFWSSGHADPARALRIFADVPGDIHPANAALSELAEAGPTWDDVAWLRSITALPIVVKGIQTAEDARLCADSGASALIVSNHGGASPSMEGLPGSASMLPEVVEAVGEKIEVYFDGGVQTGRDILKVLAIGARAVLVGRATLWGLTVGGGDGVAAILEVLARELATAMAICGVADVKAVPRSTVAIPHHWPRSPAYF